jgi:thiamine-monophosphate kinase
MDEFELIRRYFAPLATSAGAAHLQDDVAEIARLADGAGLIITCDAIVEGVHFLAGDPISTVAQKLVRVNVSDILAKGGRPDAAVLALTWPKSRDLRELDEFARALGADLARWGAHLAGGDTTSTPGPLTLSLTLTGKVDARGPVRRAGAHVGDDVWVSGVIGDGWLGLQAALGRFPALAAEGLAAMTTHYRTPAVPKLAMAGLVAAHASASIDVSDGLVADAAHIADASGVALEIRTDAVPLSAAGANYVENGRVLLVELLTGGDDYQVLFTAPAAAREAIAGAGLSLTRIGRVEAGSGVRLRDGAGVEMVTPRTGWRHFEA